MTPLLPTLQERWRQLIDLGVHPGLSLLETRRVRTVNGLAVLGMLVECVFLFFCVAAQVRAAIWANVAVLLFVCLPVLGLQARRHYLAARLLAFFAPVGLGTWTGTLSAVALESRARPEVLLFSFAVLNVLLFDGGLRRLALAAIVSGYVWVQLAPAVLRGHAFEPVVGIAIGNALGAFLLTHVVASLYKGDVIRSQEVILAQNRELAEQRAQIQAQADELLRLNRVKDRLFSIIGHDLRAPVAALRDLVAETRDWGMSREEFRRLLDQLGAHVDQSSQLLENLLRWAESQMSGFEPKPEPVDLGALIDGQISLFRPVAVAKGIELRAMPGAAGVVELDRAMLDVALRNLVSNALKFTPRGGRVEVRTSRDAACLAIEVADTGVGMAPAQVEEAAARGGVSRPGTAGEVGTGLGLLLVRDFVAANGGAFRIDSAPAQGTRVTLTFPSPPAVSPNSA